MFNLIIFYEGYSWISGTAELERSRVAIEYTANEISERYKFFDDHAIEELKSFPSIFVTENEATESRIGRVTNIRLRQNTIAFDYEFDQKLPSLPVGAIEQLRVDVDLGKWELSRTHWAIKDESLFKILIKKRFITLDQFNASQFSKSQTVVEPPLLQTELGKFNTSQIFVVHGHDEIAKLEMESFILSLGLQPIILHMQPSSGRTIIEKIEHYSNVGFGVVLYTPCDVGNKIGELAGNYRARQNVVFEHGFLIGKLGRSRVSAVVKGEIEKPNDISGVVYVEMDQEVQWKTQLLTELRGAGYQV